MFGIIQSIILECRNEFANESLIFFYLSVNLIPIVVGKIELRNIATMIGERSNTDNEWVTIATKVSKRDKAKIKAIAELFGMTFYELLQSLLLSFLRYFDIGKLSTYDHNCMMDAFSNIMHSLKGSYNPLQKKGSESREICRAILFVQDSPKKRPQMLSIKKNENGLMIESLNYDEMTTIFLSCLDPDSFRGLEEIRKEIGCFSITHTLHEVIMQRTSETDVIKADINELFTDIRIPSGEAINEDVHYNRGHRQNVDEYTTITPKQTYRADL